MAILIIIANQPIRLDRDVAGDEVLATIETEHNVATLLMMLQQKQARLVINDANADKPDANADKPEVLIPVVNLDLTGNQPLPTFAERLAAAEINDKSIELLAAAGVSGIAKAELYLAEHDGSFESIKGIGKKTSDKVIELLSQKS